VQRKTDEPASPFEALHGGLATGLGRHRRSPDRRQQVQKRGAGRDQGLLWSEL
jgi:hypothetical protein